MACLDDSGARGRKAVRKRIGAGDIDDLKLAVAHGLNHEPGVRVDDHGAEIELSAFEHRELLVQWLCGHFDVQLGELRHHLPRHVLAAAPDRTNPDPHAPKVRHRPDTVRIAPEHDERLGDRQASDQLERVRLGPRKALLHQCELDAARRLGRDQARDVLDGARAWQIVDAPALALRFRGHLGDDRVVVALFAAREEGDLGKCRTDSDSGRTSRQGRPVRTDTANSKALFSVREGACVWLQERALQSRLQGGAHDVSSVRDDGIATRRHDLGAAHVEVSVAQDTGRDRERVGEAYAARGSGRIRLRQRAERGAVERAVPDSAGIAAHVEGGDRCAQKRSPASYLRTHPEFST